MTSLGDRMKEYEFVSQTKLTRRTPVIMRIDGRAFHTFTRGFEKPFDNRLIEVMQEVTLALCNKISNVKFAYTQSDEISILMTDWDNLETMPFFDNKVQKLCSICAAMATSEFINKWFDKTKQLVNIQFDCRVFNIPEQEINNYFLWRQQDWTRNSISMVGRSKFSAKQLHGVNTNKLQDILFKEHGINWNDYDTYLKRGTGFWKEGQDFIIDKDIPIFSQDKDFIKSTYYKEDEE